MLKKSYIFILNAYFLLHIFNILGTMGDSSNIASKNVTVYGRIETYVLPEKKIEQLTFWNKQLKVNVYEVPNEWCIEDTKNTTEEKTTTLNFNPSEQGTIATITLQEIQSITAPQRKNTIIFSTADKTKQEFILIKITFHGNSSRCYLVDKREKLFCKEKNGNEIISLEIPVRSIKKLTIDGYSTTNRQCS